MGKYIKLNKVINNTSIYVNEQTIVTIEKLYKNEETPNFYCTKLCLFGLSELLVSQTPEEIFELINNNGFKINY